MAIDVDRQQTIVHDQAAIERANILILGCGAIGSQTAPILQRMGAGRVGTITLVDGDNVEPHNLNRQLFGPDHVGMNKALAVREQLLAVDPDVNVEAIPQYLQINEIKPEQYDYIVFAADSLYLEGLLYEQIRKAAKPPVFISPRMGGFAAELFTVLPGKDPPKNIYFNDKPDKNYDAGATCTGPRIEERKIPSISTATTFLSSLAAQAFLHATQGWEFKNHFKVDLRLFFSGEVISPAPTPKP